MPEKLIGIKIIRGCGRDNFPYLVREADKLFCMNRETKKRKDRRFSKFRLIEREARQAFCAESGCVHQSESEALEFCHSATYLRRLREQSFLI